MKELKKPYMGAVGVGVAAIAFVLVWFLPTYTVIPISLVGVGLSTWSLIRTERTIKALRRNREW